jgi:hypothetical protein
VLETAARARGRAKQEIFAHVPGLRALALHRYRERLKEFEPHLPVLPTERLALVRDVQAHGVAVTSLDALGLPGTEELKSGTTTLIDHLADSARAGTVTVGVPRARVLGCPAVWQWGLNGELLDMVEHYLGQPVRYLGAGMRCERATGEAFGVRQWHRDVEDHRMLKLLVWLNDVDEHGGPFEYVDRDRTSDLTRSMHYVSGFVSDEALTKRVPQAEWRRATGPKWTCVVTDPRNVFHRAMPPTEHDRYSLTLSYTSRSPIRTLPGRAVSERERELATRGLDDRQLACLPRAYTR